MLDRQLIRDHPELVLQGARRKNVQAPVEEFLKVDSEWRRVNTELDNRRAEMNRMAKSIGHLMAQGQKDEAEKAKTETAQLKALIQELEEQERNLGDQLRTIELKMPNLPHESVPDGDSPEDNVVVRKWGDKPVLPFEPRPHWEIGEELGLFEAERASKISGSGFMVYTGWGARLQRALFNFMIDFHTVEGEYREIYPPFLVNRASLIGTGNLPKFEEDLYRCDEDLFLIPTAEVPVTNLYRDEILEAWQLPMNLAAYSGCFRKEAGAAGKDTRGLLRMHQFDKVELVKFVLPEQSYDALESLTQDAERVLQALGLHYRVVLLSAGDMGEKGCKCYDLEVWAPGVGRYLEISSCTNFEAYQARRANIRFRRGPGEKPEFVHILNGSGLACARLYAALLETYLLPEGGVQVPESLQPYVKADVLEKG